MRKFQFNIALGTYFEIQPTLTALSPAMRPAQKPYQTRTQIDDIPSLRSSLTMNSDAICLHLRIQKTKFDRALGVHPSSFCPLD